MDFCCSVLCLFQDVPVKVKQLLVKEKKPVQFGSFDAKEVGNLTLKHQANGFYTALY